MYAHKISLSAGADTHRKIHVKHLRLVICGVRGIGIKLGIGELGIKENTKNTKQKKGLLMTMCRPENCQLNLVCPRSFPPPPSGLKKGPDLGITLESPTTKTGRV